tara:strand:- start:249 stop:422 length:174 start_codon:yes stop_codon:yes gene_type:complete
MIVLKEKNSWNTLVFKASEAKEAQKILDAGKHDIESDKSSLLTAKKAKAKKVAKAKK